MIMKHHAGWCSEQRTGGRAGALCPSTVKSGQETPWSCKGVLYRSAPFHSCAAWTAHSFAKKRWPTEACCQDGCVAVNATFSACCLTAEGVAITRSVSNRDQSAVRSQDVFSWLECNSRMLGIHDVRLIKCILTPHLGNSWLGNLPGQCLGPLRP